MDTGKLILRLFVGGVFAAHGLQKLRGWFGGPGIEGTTRITSSLGIRPARANAYAIAVTETVGGLAIAAGAATPAASAGLVAAMTTAIRTVHWPTGFFATQGGWEFNGTLIAAVVALTADGPGRFSLDAALGRRRWGIGWSLAALGVGVGASYAVTELGARVAGGDDAPAPADASAGASDDDAGAAA